jgi:hypothetical protein
MIRRNLGRRLSDQTMEERQQTAEQAARGAGYVAPNPLVAAGISGATSQFMGDTPQETAGRVAMGLLPAAGGRLAAAAPRAAAATYGAGATMLPQATQTEAADRNAVRLEEAKADRERAQRRADAQKRQQDINDFVGWKSDPTNKKTLEGFSPEWQSQIKGAADMKTAQGLFLQAAEEKRGAEEFKNWRTDNKNAVGSLAEGYQNRIAGAKNLEEARAIFKEGADARKEAGMTLAERYPNAMTALEVAVPIASMALPAYSRGRQLNALERASAKGEAQFNKTFGEGAPELTQGRLNEVDAAARDIRAGQAMTSFDPRKPQSWKEHVGEIAGGTALAYAGNTGLPGLVDYAMGSLSSDPGGAERASKALANMTSKERIGVALGEGTLGTLAGNRLMDWTRSPVFARAESSAANLEKANRTISPGSVLTQTTSPPVPVPAAPPAAPPASPAPQPAAPPDVYMPPSRPFPTAPPVEQMPGYIPGLWGAALTAHEGRLRREWAMGTQPAPPAKP